MDSPNLDPHLYKDDIMVGWLEFNSAFNRIQQELIRRSDSKRELFTTISHMMNEWMNENARILSAFENRLRAGFV